MTQIGELFSPAVLANMKNKCPFQPNDKTGRKKEDENIADDDLDNVQELQTNDGGTLGKNVQVGAPGDADSGEYLPDNYVFTQEQDDSEHSRRMKLQMKGYRDATAGNFPFTVAAHHLIPGN